jgi:hypothetical protein
VYEKQVGNFSIHFGDALQVCFGVAEAKKSGELLSSFSFLYNKEAFVANFKTFSFQIF